MAIADSTNSFRSAASILSMEVVRVSMSIFSFAIIAEPYLTLKCVNPSSISNGRGKNGVGQLIAAPFTELDSMIRCGERLWGGETLWKAEVVGHAVPTRPTGGALTPNPKTGWFP